MASFPIPAIRKRGPILNGLTALPASVKMMTVDDAGNMGTQDIPVAPVLSWGNITGTLSTQTDLQTALNAKSSVGHVHAISDVTGLSDVLIALDAAKLNTTSFNFASIGGNAGDNTSLAAALASKANATHTHAIGDVTNLQSSLDAKANSSALASYVAKSGDTMTGNLALNSVTDILTSPKILSFQHLGVERGYIRNVLDTVSSAVLPELSIRRVLLGGNDGMYSPIGISGGSQSKIYFTNNGESILFMGQSLYHWFAIHGGQGFINFGNSIGFTTTGGAAGSADLTVGRDAADTLALRRSTNAQRINLYGTYTDASNYRRLYLSSTTAGAFTFGVEGLGTGASGNTLGFASPVTISGYATGSVGLTIQQTPAVNVDLMQWRNAAGTLLGRISDIGVITCPIITPGQIAGTPIVNPGTLFLLDTNHSIRALAGQGLALYTFGVSPGIFLQQITGNVGIGSGLAAPGARLNVSSSMNNLGFGDGVQINWADDVGVNRPVVGFYRSRGSISSPTNISSNDVIGSFSFFGRSGGTNNAYATIRSVYESGSGGNLEFWTSPSSTGNDEVLRLAINRNGLLQLGGTSSSFPAIKRNGTAINFRLADDSADAPIIANAGTFQDIGQMSSALCLRVLAGGIFLGQGISVFSVDGAGNVYARLNCAAQSFTSANYTLEGGWGGLARAVSIPEGAGQGGASNGNSLSSTYGLAITTGAGFATHFVSGTNPQKICVYQSYTNNTNYIRQSLSFTTYSTVVHAQLAAEGLGTGAVNIPFVITPRGTGAFIVGPMPDGTATGGNARGANAIDLQTARSAATQVASGARAVIFGGSGNTASGGSSGCGGEGSTASGYGSFSWGPFTLASGIYAVAFARAAATAPNSFAFGFNARSDRNGQFSHANGSFSTGGDAQKSGFVVRNTTTDATPTTLLTGNEWNGVATTRLTVNAGEILGFIVNIAGSKSDGSAIAHYVRKGAIKRVGTTTTLAYVETVGTDYEDNAATNVSITADDTNEALQIQVTGIAGETWRWVATVEAVDLGYGT